MTASLRRGPSMRYTSRTTPSVCAVNLVSRCFTSRSFSSRHRSCGPAGTRVWTWIQTTPGSSVPPSSQPGGSLRLLQRPRSHLWAGVLCCTQRTHQRTTFGQHCWGCTGDGGVAGRDCQCSASVRCGAGPSGHQQTISLHGFQCGCSVGNGHEGSVVPCHHHHYSISRYIVQYAC